MLNNLHFENFHSFIIYGFFGTLFSYLLVKILIKYKKIDDPKAVSRLLLIPLAAPFFTTAISAYYLKDKCLVGFSGQEGIFKIFDALCTISSVMGEYFTPVILIGFSIAITKSTLSMLLCYRQTFKHEIDDTDMSSIARLKLEELSAKAGIGTPKFVVTRQSYARCFTFGYKKPIIVMSQGVLKYFEEDEIEAILAHEIGHIVRSDSLKSWISQFLRDMLFFNPIAYFTFKDLITENEKAADDIAILLTKKPIVFAETLLKFWKYAPKSAFGNVSSLAASHFAKDISDLEVRVKRSLGQKVFANPFPTFIYSAGITALSVGLLLIIC